MAAAAASRLFILVLTIITANAAQVSALTSFVSFTFSSDRCGESNISSDNSSRSSISYVLRRMTNVTSCAPSAFGLTSTTTADESTTSVDVLELKTNEDDLWKAIGADGAGISIEIWLKGALNDALNDDSDVRRPILTVGQIEMAQDSYTSPTPEDLSVCGKNQLNFQIAQRGRHLELLYRTSDEVFEPCQESTTSIAAEMSDDRLTHIVVSLQDNQQLLFINGRLELSLSRPFSNDLSGWQRSIKNSSLHLFAYPMMQESTSVWAGTIYRVALHKKFLSDSAVTVLLRDGLPPSSPYALYYTVSINEDAERYPESHSPDWYLQQSPINEAQDIILRMGWVDREVRDLQDSLNLSTSDDLRPVYTYVTNLPVSGCLYQIDGTLIGCGVNNTNNSLLLPIFGELQNFVFLPPLNKHSAVDESGSMDTFSTISYCVSDKVLVSATQCSAHGHVEVVVVPVNDPPIALSPGTVKVKESVDSSGAPKMLLSGTDVDEGDSVQLVQITRPPSKGLLLLSVSSFRRDNLRHGTRFSDLGNEVMSSTSDPVYAMYVWDPSKANGVVVQGSAVSDSFSFRVTDKNGAWSAEQKVSIKIVSAVSCQTTDLVTLPEDSPLESNLLWFANDTSGYKRDLWFFIESVPEPEVGVLLYNNSNRVIKSGDLLDFIDAFPYKRGLSLSFQPSPNFCNDLETNPYLSIKYHAVAVETKSGQIVSVSDPQVQKIEVVCAPDELDLTVPLGPLSVAAMTLKSAAKYFRLLANDTTRAGNDGDSEYALRISGIKATSYDTAKHLVNVTVSTGSGYLTLNQHYRKLADPTHGRCAMRGGSLSFWASPFELENILTNLTYSTYTPGEDTINIYLEYGNCTKLRNQTLIDKKSSMWATPTCQLLWHSIPVAVFPDPNRKPSTTLLSGCKWQLLQLFLSMLCYPSLFYVVSRLEDTWDSSNDDDEVTVFDASDPIWVQHVCPDTGDFYYENRENGTVTWMAPVGESYIPWEAQENDHQDDDAENQSSANDLP